jgi:hypothetical protein
MSSMVTPDIVQYIHVPLRILRDEELGPKVLYAFHYVAGEYPNWANVVEVPDENDPLLAIRVSDRHVAGFIKHILTTTYNDLLQALKERNIFVTVDSAYDNGDLLRKNPPERLNKFA